MMEQSIEGLNFEDVDQMVQVHGKSVFKAAPDNVLMCIAEQITKASV
jgi:hypothetical protein